MPCPNPLRHRIITSGVAHVQALGILRLWHRRNCRQMHRRARSHPLCWEWPGQLTVSLAPTVLLTRPAMIGGTVRRMQARPAPAEPHEERLFLTSMLYGQVDSEYYL